jgi:cobalt-zinc-cadmium efflux system membrane fusion protein
MKQTFALFFIIFCTSLTAAVQASEEHDHKHSKDSAHEEAHDQKHSNKENHDDDEHGHDAEKEHDHDEGSHHDDGEEDEHGHGEENSTEINDAMAQKVGIEIAQTGSQTLHQTFTTYGRLTTAPESASHVRARFPGIVRSVAFNIGDQVKEGDLLAVIESNESLKRYDVRAPIGGTIIQRHANKGEMTQEQVLFSIASFESLWADLRIFSTQQQSINIGQPIHVTAGEKRIDSRISHMLPAEEDSPYLIVRAKINNTKNNWFPGLMVEGKIVINEFETPIAVKNSALQTMGGRTGIFVKEHDDYRFTPLVLGRSDDEFTEVLSGVQGSTQYVIANSYLIKADIEKSEAEHEH